MVREEIEQPFFDARAEVLAAYLSTKGENMVSISPEDTYSYGTQNEIAALNLEKDEVTIKVRRKGLYDQLPEALFIEFPQEGTSAEKAAEIANQIASAKQFFRPFDEALNAPKIEMERYEQVAPEKIVGSLNNLIEFTGMQDLLTPRQTSMLNNIVPYLSKIIGDVYLTEQFITEFLGDEVKIIRSCVNTSEIPIEKLSTLGEARLGVNVILDQKAPDSNYGITLKVTPSNADKLMDYLPTNKFEKMETRGRKLIKILIHFLLPIENFPQILIEPKLEDCFSILDALKIGHNRLDFSMTL